MGLMRDKIVNFMKAGYPGIFIVSTEEQRIETEIIAACKKTKHKLYIWCVTQGMFDVVNKQVDKDLTDATDAVLKLFDLEDNAAVIYRDLHMFWQGDNPDPILVRAIKDMLYHAKTRGKVIFVLGCKRNLPPELEKEFAVVEFGLPDKDTLKRVLNGIAKSAKIESNGNIHNILEAASGMTTTEAENAFALSLVKHKSFDPKMIADAKSEAVAKSGLLEVVHPRQTLDDIGGLDLLKNWIKKRKDAFGKEAREYGLPAPKGLLIIGVPGTGKSLTCKVVANVLQRPIVRLDVGKLFGGLVGASESNTRLAIEVSEAIAPCVLWIDEIEKAFSGTKSSNATDGGTSARVFGTFISWMQEKTAPVFIVATANDVSQLPPEMLRKGRYDEVFFCDLPTMEEREEIWKIQIRKYKRDPKKYNIKDLAANTKGFTGAEIEQVFIDSLYVAFAKHKEPNMSIVNGAILSSVPLSKMMGNKIDALRQWSAGRTRPASSHMVLKVKIGPASQERKDGERQIIV